MTETRGPTVRRRQLGMELRRLREAAGKTTWEAAQWLEMSQSNLSKIEHGRQAIKGTHVRLLAQLYGIGAPKADALMQLARQANQRSWWVDFGDTVPEWVRPYLGLEEDASQLWAYESGLVVGLFQTPAYAEAITAAAHPEASTDELARWVAFRTARQERIFGDRPPSLRVILDEAVLHRLVGGPKVMREQLEHLIEVATLPHVDLAVHPFSAGAHPSMGSAFTLLWVADTVDMTCVYLEHDRGALYLERSAEVDHYSAMFERLSATALGAAETRKLMTGLAAEL